MASLYLEHASPARTQEQPGSKSAHSVGLGAVRPSLIVTTLYQELSLQDSLPLDLAIITSELQTISQRTMEISGLLVSGPEPLLL
jgi:hypothetical protein